MSRSEQIRASRLARLSTPKPTVAAAREEYRALVALEHAHGLGKGAALTREQAKRADALADIIDGPGPKECA